MDGGDEAPGEVLATVREGDVDFAWDDGTGAREVDFEVGPALAVLLAREVVFANCQHWREDLSEADRGTAALFVNCSDVFSWASAEGEILPWGEIERLYGMWRRDPAWGPAAWAVLARGCAPQGPVAKRMAEAGWEVARLAEGGASARAYVDGVCAGSRDRACGRADGQAPSAVTDDEGSDDASG